MQLKKYLLFLGILIGFASAGWADMIYTQGDRVYEGVITEENENTVTILLQTGTVQLPKSAILKVVKQATATPLSTPTPTPWPTVTRFPTTIPTRTPTPIPKPTLMPTAAPDPLATLPPLYSSEMADTLIAKYDQIQIPKAKYVLAYYSKGLHAFADKKPAMALVHWTDALKINDLLYRGTGESSENPETEPEMLVRFENALEQLRIIARKDPNAAISGNLAARRALRDVELMSLWIVRQFNLHLALAHYYEEKDAYKKLAVEHYLKAYRVIYDHRTNCMGKIEESTRQGDPFRIKGFFFDPRTEVGGRLIDSRIVEIERLLTEKFNLEPDDYLYDYE